MKSKWLIRSAIYLVLAVCALLLYLNGSDKEDTKDVIKSEKFSYEILDTSVELTDDVSKWLDDNKNKEGFYTKTTKEDVFVLISGGIQKTSGFGISLNKVEQKGQVFHIEYEVMKPSKSDKVDKKKSTPFMLLRVNSDKAEVKGEIAPIKVKTAE